MRRLAPFLQTTILEGVLVVMLLVRTAVLVVRTRPGRRPKEELDRRLLGRIPGCTLIRGLAGRITGQEEWSTLRMSWTCRSRRRCR